MEKPHIFFCSNLTFLRKQHKYKQEDMLALFSISRSTWSNYEKGKTTPTLESLVLIANKFEVTLDELITQDLKAKQEREKSNYYTRYTTISYPSNLLEEAPAIYGLTIHERMNKLESDIEKLQKMLRHRQPY